MALTFEQDLNQWCKTTEEKVQGLERKVQGIGSTQKLHIALTLTNLGLVGVLIAAILGA